jgi:hypothetical protein
MVACYSMVMAAAAVVVGKVASGACSFEATSRFSRVQISLVLREGHLLMDLPIKISPKMVFVCKTDLLERDNLNVPIWNI